MLCRFIDLWWLTCNRVILSQRTAQPLSNCDQYLVTSRVTQAVVKLLEVIQVHEQHRKFVIRMPLSAAEGLAQTVQEKSAIRQVGKRIVKGIMLKPLFYSLALGDVAVHDN